MLKVRTDTGYWLDVLEGSASRGISVASGVIDISVNPMHIGIIKNAVGLELWENNAILNKYVIESVQYSLAEDGRPALRIMGIDETGKLRWTEITKSWRVVENGDLVEDVINGDFRLDVEHNYLKKDETGQTLSSTETAEYFYPEGADWINYGFSVICEVVSGADYSVYFRYQDASTYYRFRFLPTDAALSVEMYSGTKRLGRLKAIETQFDKTLPHTLKCVLDGDSINLWIDYQDTEYEAGEYKNVDSGKGTIGYRVDNAEVKFYELRCMEKGYYFEQYQARKRKFDILRDIASSLYRKLGKPYDFWIEDGTLVFRRRTTDLCPDILIEGNNILSYSFTRPPSEVANLIEVSGAQLHTKYPFNGDLFTEGNSGEWLAWQGNPDYIDDIKVEDDPDSKVGEYSIQVYPTAGPTGYWHHLYYNLPEVVSIDEFTKYHLWMQNVEVTGRSTAGLNVILSSDTVTLHTVPPNRFTRYEEWSADTWKEFEFDLGEGAGWSVTGNPNWKEIRAVGFNFPYLPTHAVLPYIDGLYFLRRIIDVTSRMEDAASQKQWGVRGLYIDDDNIKSWMTAQAIAEYELEKRKEPEWRGTITCPYSSSIKAGKLIKIKIPSLGIDDNFIIRRTDIDLTNTRAMRIEVGPEEPTLARRIQDSRDWVAEVRRRVRGIKRKVI